jgi:hypothetical protein
VVTRLTNTEYMKTVERIAAKLVERGFTARFVRSAGTLALFSRRGSVFAGVSNHHLAFSDAI